MFHAAARFTGKQFCSTVVQRPTDQVNLDIFNRLTAFKAY